MGSFGSGRWGWTVTRATTDGLLRLDVRDLARRGLFAAGPGQVALAALAWTRCGEPAGQIAVEYAGNEPGAVVLDYQVQQTGAPWEPVRERVALDRTPCRYGGARPWFRCPGCSGRRAILHCAGGRFRCRSCHDLVYGATREAGWERARRRAAKLRARLGAEPGEAWGRPDKPRAMQWRTYSRLVRRLEAADGSAEAGLAARTEALVARFDRRQGPRDA